MHLGVRTTHTHAPKTTHTRAPHFSRHSRYVDEEAEDRAATQKTQANKTTHDPKTTQAKTTRAPKTTKKPKRSIVKTVEDRTCTTSAPRKTHASGTTHTTRFALLLNIWFVKWLRAMN